MSPTSTTRSSTRPPPPWQWWERAYIYEREFTEAYSKLGVEPPTYEPRATGHMIDMIDLIKKIIDNGHGYVVRDADGNPTGNVYFDVASWPHYGELTHQKQTAVSDAASEVTDAMGPSVDNAGNDKYNPVDPADMSPTSMIRAISRCGRRRRIPIRSTRAGIPRSARAVRAGISNAPR